MTVSNSAKNSRQSRRCNSRRWFASVRPRWLHLTEAAMLHAQLLL
jgi:hypothetical protein